MKGPISWFALLFVALAFALTIGSGAAMAQSTRGDTGAMSAKAETMTITGKVMEGKIVADNGKEYTVVNDAKGKELMKDHMGHKVEVKGEVFQKDGRETIQVSSIKHLSGG